MNLSGTNLLKVKDFNTAVVLSLVRRLGPITRRALSDCSGLSFQTVTNIAQALIDAGLLQDGDEQPGAGARPSRSLRLNADAAFAVGIHLDRKNLNLVLVNFTGRVLWRDRIVPGTDAQSFRATFPLLTGAVARALAETSVPQDRVLGVGLAAPGPLDTETGALLSVPNFGDWGNHAVSRDLRAALGLEVMLDEDVTAMILGEQWCGLAVDVFNAVYLYLGAGIGLGVIANGQALRGWKGNIGQIGHVAVEAGGEPCVCGKRGCLEAYATPQAIARDIRIAALRREHARGGGGDLHALSVDELLASPDPLVHGAILEAARRVGDVLSTVVALVDPELVILGGETLALLPERFLSEVTQRLPGSLMASHPLPLVRVSSLGEDAGPVGAASLIFHEVYAPSLRQLNLL